MSLPSIDQQLRSELEAWAAAGLERRIASPRGLDFCTNDYLALARDTRLVDAACAATRAHGAGTGAARLLGGESPVHAEAERAAAAWLGSKAALLLPSGWHANLAVLGTLGAEGDVLLSDRLNHASLIDGARLARADVEVFAHNDVADLACRLAAAGRYRRRWIVVESVYSTDGSLAPLADYAELALRYDAWLIVDEAHGAGLYGSHGEGRCTDAHVRDRVVARTITGGKALGVAGAFIAGSADVCELILQRGRAFVFTTAAPPGSVAALLEAVRIVQAEPERRRRAHEAAAHLRKRLAALRVETPGESPIVPIPIGAPEAAVAVAKEIQTSGFDVRAVRPPTVPEGESCLRVICHADHRAADLEALAACIAGAMRRHAPVEAPAVPRTPRPLVVVGTDTGVGKTVVSALLCRAALRTNRDVHYLKPVQTGADSDTAAVRTLAGLPPTRALDPVVALPLPASVDQAATAAGVRVTIADVLERTRARLRAEPEGRWILETAGGVLVPFNEHEDQAGLLRELAAPVVLVARSGLGTLNHTRLTVEALRRRGVTVRAVFLVGPTHEANERTLRTRLAGTRLYRVPRFEAVDAGALDAWIAENDLEGIWP